jgi:hypothetical protein
VTKDITPRGNQATVRKALASGNIKSVPLKSRSATSTGIQKASLKERPGKGVD